ncbi:37S ribosomal protein S18 [Aspergillus uvarum CBS 121591]|uniref:Small ribosomal subunit protein bS18m n=1 Tax=Aspergillus uvarum CBS 121591 TaxID=1448315 RepID=A0A319DA89_9EURO|nr:37S ribosomal protein S18 [Aspergillus uvarum CBS 121591]PYH84918.1 37S ribosomal protein S18 [Aspergillus uvarum CBS 121591]
MALHLFSWSPLRTIGSTFNAASARRWNWTAAPNAAATAEHISILHNNTQRTTRRRARRFIEEQKAINESRPLERFQTREWKAGDIYAPHDLSPSQMRRWKERHSPSTDVFDSLNLNPLTMYKNFSIMSEYMTPMGQIKHRNETGLRPVNQRKMAKAIRRAVGLGLMPSVHRHPEILAAQVQSRLEGGSTY